MIFHTIVENIDIFKQQKWVVLIMHKVNKIDPKK